MQQKNLLRCTMQKEAFMTKRSTISVMSDLFSVFGSAVAVSHAVDSRKTPSEHHLRNLGISPEAFKNIRHF